MSVWPLHCMLHSFLVAASFLIWYQKKFLLIVRRRSFVIQVFCRMRVCWMLVAQVLTWFFHPSKTSKIPSKFSTIDPLTVRHILLGSGWKFAWAFSYSAWAMFALDIGSKIAWTFSYFAWAIIAWFVGWKFAWVRTWVFKFMQWLWQFWRPLIQMLTFFFFVEMSLLLQLWSLSHEHIWFWSHFLVALVDDRWLRGYINPVCALSCLRLSVFFCWCLFGTDAGAHINRNIWPNKE